MLSWTVGKITSVFYKTKALYFNVFYSRKVSLRARFYGKGIILRGRDITIGENTTINNYVILNAIHSKITIGKNCRLSDGVKIVAVGLNHERKHVAKEVVIGDNVQLGTGSIVLFGVMIGKNSIISAGAVVSTDIPENVVAVCLPARVVKSTDDFGK